MSINRTAQVAAATAAVVVGALCTQGVANASDHSHHNHHGSHASDRDHHGDDGDDHDRDKNHLDVAGLDLGQVTDAVSDLLNSLSDVL
ncbi:MAG TPA: hypothetical protein VH008_28640 [Pseudonocardia sp.]|nr:hypothetical protein [Pseudonocardia sp.]